MKRVDAIARVRRAFHAQGWSMKNISRELHMSRNTLRKILRSGETDFTYEREHQPLPKIGPWVEHVDRFLRANAGKAARELLTLIRIYEEVRALGYDGSYDAVRRYAQTWSKARGSATADAYVPLYYAPGEAYQFDWSHEIVLISDGDKQMVSILGCVSTDGIVAVKAACKEALDQGAFSAPGVINILARNSGPKPRSVSIPIASHPNRVAPDS